MKSRLESAMNSVLLMISRCLNFLKVVTYLCELMEAVGLHISGKLYSELYRAYFSHLAALTEDTFIKSSATKPE